MQVNAGALDCGLALDDLPHSSRLGHNFPRIALDTERPGGCIARWERLFVSLIDAILFHVLPPPHVERYRIIVPRALKLLAEVDR